MDRLHDASVEACYIDSDKAYRPAKETLSRCYQKLREGGVLVGRGYLDGVEDGLVYGVKTAVDEFAGELAVTVRLTLDKTPGWWLVKPPDKPEHVVCDRRKLALLTAYDDNQTALAAISSPNKRRYCETNGYAFIEETVGFETSRVPAWSKIRFLKKHLQNDTHDWIFWSDADSLIMNGAARLEDLIAEADAEGYHVVIGLEDHGVGLFNVNAGQFFIKRSAWSIEFLDEVWAQEQFVTDRMQENRAIIHLLWQFDLSRHVMIVAQRRFNSYPINYLKGDFLLHFPDIPNHQRLKMMMTYEQFSTVRQREALNLHDQVPHTGEK